MTATTHDLIRGALTIEQANAVFDVLVEVAAAPVGMRDNFVHAQTTGHCSEYRFQGVLGFGGKFWRSSNRWYVTAYPEDVVAQPGRQAVIDEADGLLNKLLTVLSDDDTPVSWVIYEQVRRGGATVAEALRLATDPDVDWPMW